MRTLLLDILATVAPEADLDALPPDAPLREELDLDSMDFLRVVQAIDARTGIAIPELDYPKLYSLDDVVAYLEARSQLLGVL